ncbi:hypothetical protein TRVL_02565 [Trypanosoma vivax]|nr:hypothetical protein TRVL_02565 [Trypanosoma vivax]
MRSPQRSGNSGTQACANACHDIVVRQLCLTVRDRDGGPAARTQEVVARGVGQGEPVHPGAMCEDGVSVHVGLWQTPVAGCAPANEQWTWTLTYAARQACGK